MKKIFGFMLLALVCLAELAVARDKVLYDEKSSPKVPIQNLHSLAPAKGGQRSNTSAFTKNSFKGYSTTGNLGNEVEVVDSAGAGVSVKWFLDGVLTWIGSTFSFTNPGGSTYAKVSFQPYSTTPRNLTSVYKGQ